MSDSSQKNQMSTVEKQNTMSVYVDIFRPWVWAYSREDVFLSNVVSFKMITFQKRIILLKQAVNIKFPFYSTKYCDA